MSVANVAPTATVRTLVVKIGSALLTHPQAGLAVDKIEAYCAQIHQLQQQGYSVVLVSSGAVVEGCARLGWRERPQTVHQLQAAAAVGQMGLAQAYERALMAHQCSTAMIMLTHDDLANRERYLNARATLSQLLELGVVPVVNENDTVATEEIRFGDNDTLAALVTNLLQAEMLIILTDVNGLMDADPRRHPEARRVPWADADDPSLDSLPGAGSGELGRGGMVTKLAAARLAARSGADTIIASGLSEDVLLQCVGDADIGTRLLARMSPLTARKHWLAGQLRAKGDLQLDAGAAKAIRERGVSLLAVGLSGVQGTFQRGDLVRCLDPQGVAIAQGLTNYGHQDLAKLVGVRSEDFAECIDYVAEPEVVHRDNLVIL